MTDAHCHPWDLLEFLPNAEDERRKTGTACAASSWNLKEFEYHENLAKKAREEAAPIIFCGFALHPQLAPSCLETVDVSCRQAPLPDCSISDRYKDLEIVEMLAAQGRLDAVGETGFDLYSEKFKAAEKIQDEMFVCHLETAVKYGLPLVLHLRRAMHKIFPFSGELKKLPAVIFHSWPGTRGEGEALLHRGINAFFSFGATVVNNHKEAMRCSAFFPADRILLETDAPYQPLRGKTYSSWQDLDAVCKVIAALRKESGTDGSDQKELEVLTTINFYRAFSK